MELKAEHSPVRKKEKDSYMQNFFLLLLYDLFQFLLSCIYFKDKEVKYVFSLKLSRDSISHTCNKAGLSFHRVQMLYWLSHICKAQIEFGEGPEY